MFSRWGVFALARVYQNHGYALRSIDHVRRVFKDPKATIMSCDMTLRDV